MGYTTSTVHGIEVPDSAEANNVPEDIGKVVTALEAGSLVKRLTGAQISALTSPQKPAGLVVYNTTTGTLQISNGTSFVDFWAARYYCTATQSGQTLAPNADCIVTYDGEIDPGSMLNTGTGVATIPAKGLYTVSGGLGYTADTVGDAFRRLRVLVSGTPIAEQSNVTHSGMLSVSWTGVLNASATVSLDCLHNNSGNLTGIGWMSVAFLGTVAS